MIQQTSEKFQHFYRLNFIDHIMTICSVYTCYIKLKVAWQHQPTISTIAYTSGFKTREEKNNYGKKNKE